MASYYLESSALVKRYVAERGKLDAHENVRDA